MMNKLKTGIERLRLQGWNVENFVSLENVRKFIRVHINRLMSMLGLPLHETLW